MKRTLRGIRQTPPDMDSIKEGIKNIDPSVVNSIQDTVDKYSGKSQEQLMDELMTAKRRGLIDPDELASAAKRITPMLTDEQNHRLESILSMLK